MNKRKILTLVLAAIMLVGTIVGSMSTAFADATIALDNIKDKTVLTNEVQTLADLNSELQVHLESLDAPVLP